LQLISNIITIKVPTQLIQTSSTKITQQSVKIWFQQCSKGVVAKESMQLPMQFSYCRKL